MAIEHSFHLETRELMFDQSLLPKIFNECKKIYIYYEEGEKPTISVPLACLPNEELKKIAQCNAMLL